MKLSPDILDQLAWLQEQSGQSRVAVIEAAITDYYYARDPYMVEVAERRALDLETLLQVAEQVFAASSAGEALRYPLAAVRSRG